MTRSHILFEQAKKYIAGGVNSPVRAFNGVSGEPLFIKNGLGAYITDVDDQRYIDYVGSWGPLILGHAHPCVIHKVKTQLANGLSYGAPTEIENELAKSIAHHMPAIEKLRFVSSGTEAAMSAIRLARGFTGRQKIIKFDGCYHGHTDCLLVSAGSGALTFGIPSSQGVTPHTAQDTLVATYNDLHEVKAFFEQYADDIAAIIVEPIAGNMNLVLPEPGFLAGLRQLCDEYGSVLIFDEVITGFRVGLGGASALYQITPDLTILGKIIGGGLPVAAFGGKTAIMDYIAPNGPVYQAGTLSGNPVAMAAGLATLNMVGVPNFYEEVTKKTHFLIHEIQQCAHKRSLPFYAQFVGGMFGLFFTEATTIKNLSDVKRCDLEAFKIFFHSMLQQGIYLAPSAYEIGFMSAAHGQHELTATIEAADKAFTILMDRQLRTGS